MPRPRTSPAHAAMLLLLCVAGSALWAWHAHAWGLGSRSPVLNYDTAQTALAARQLAATGRLETTFALPLELVRHPHPPWPLAVVQPGMALVEAAIFRLAPRSLTIGKLPIAQWGRPDEREWLVIPIVFACYLLAAAALALAASHLVRRAAPGSPRAWQAAAGAVVGLAFLLDPEAQHFATSGFTELPFTYLLAGAFGALALGPAATRPLFFGLLLGTAGAFRANMLWLGPPLCLAAALSAPAGSRRRVLVRSLAGGLLPLVPWWIYKWLAFGSPAWDLTRYVVWDGIGGRTWFSLYHVPELPRTPGGLEAVRLLAGKTLSNLPALTLDLLAGPGALWAGAIVLWIALGRGTRASRLAAGAVLATVVLSLVAAAVSIPWLRYLFPARAVFQAAGLLAVWGLAARIPAAVLGTGGRRAVAVAAAALALGWGGFQTGRGLSEARAVSQVRGVPRVLTLLELSVLIRREVPASEPVMSNLGPMLAWHARRPVLHLALAPEDLEACRRRVDFHHVVLAFRDPESAWPAWRAVMARPLEALHRPEWNVVHVRRYESSDGFVVVWLELGTRRPALAEGGHPRAGRRPGPRFATAAARTASRTPFRSR